MRPGRGSSEQPCGGRVVSRKPRRGRRHDHGRFVPQPLFLKLPDDCREQGVGIADLEKVALQRDVDDRVLRLPGSVVWQQAGPLVADVAVALAARDVAPGIVGFLDMKNVQVGSPRGTSFSAKRFTRSVSSSSLSPARALPSRRAAPGRSAPAQYRLVRLSGGPVFVSPSAAPRPRRGRSFRHRTPRRLRDVGRLSSWIRAATGGRRRPGGRRTGHPGCRPHRPGRSVSDRGLPGRLWWRSRRHSSGSCCPAG